MRLYEDEIGSVEGPDARRGGPEGTAPMLSDRAGRRLTNAQE